MPPSAPRILLVHRLELFEWQVRPAEQPFWRMYWNDAAGAEVENERGGAAVPLTPDRLVLISPDTWFRSRLHRPVRHTHVHALLGQPADDARGIVTAVPLDAARRRQAAELARQADGMRRELHALSLFAWAAAQLPPSSWPAPAADARVVAAQATLSGRLADPPSNRELAAAAGLHPHAFERLFRRHAGVSPHAWGLRRRLDEACRRLLHGDERIGDIARACGFADHRHFGAAFRRRFAASPLQFRRGSGQR